MSTGTTNRNRHHPDYHAEAVALVGDDVPRVVAVSWALADSHEAAYRSGRRERGRFDAVSQYERVRQAVQALPTLGIPENVEARQGIIDALCAMMRRSSRAKLVGNRWIPEDVK